MRFPAVIDGGAVGPVGIRDLDRGASGFVRSIEDGKRHVITNHGQPQAIVFSMRDAVELALDAELRELEALALDEFHASGAVELSSAWATERARRLYLSKLASRSLEESRPALQSQILAAELRSVRSGAEHPLWLERPAGGRWLVPFTLLDRETLVVHALVDAWEVEAELVGEALCGDRRRRTDIRLEHCRDLIPRATALRRLSPSPRDS